MATQLVLEKTSPDGIGDRASDLQRAEAQHAQALISGIEVVQALHDRGVLELMKGALNSGDKVLEILVQAANTPEAIRGMRNLLIMAEVLGSIQPELLKKFALAIPDALVGAAKAEQSEPPGFWGVLRIFRSKNLRHGLTLINSLLEGWGKNFSAKHPAKLL